MAVDEFNLATEEGKTAIKFDTEFIKNQFPIVGGTDFSKYKPYNIQIDKLEIIPSQQC